MMSVFAFEMSSALWLHANVTRRPESCDRIASMSASFILLPSFVCEAFSFWKAKMITDGWLKLARTIARVCSTCRRK